MEYGIRDARIKTLKLFMNGKARVFEPKDEQRGWLFKWEGKYLYKKWGAIPTDGTKGDHHYNVFYHMKENSLRITLFRISKYDGKGRHSQKEWKRPSMSFHKNPDQAINFSIVNGKVRVTLFTRPKKGQSMKPEMKTYADTMLDSRDRIERIFSLLPNLLKTKMREYMNEFIIHHVNRIVQANCSEFQNVSFGKHTQIKDIALMLNHPNCPTNWAGQYLKSTSENGYVAKKMAQGMGPFLTYVYGSKGKWAKKVSAKPGIFSRIRLVRLRLEEAGLHQPRIEKFIETCMGESQSFFESREVIKRISLEGLKSLVVCLNRENITKDEEGYGFSSRGEDRAKMHAHDCMRMFLEIEQDLPIALKKKPGEDTDIIARNFEKAKSQKNLERLHNDLSKIQRDIMLVMDHVDYDLSLFEGLINQEFEFEGVKYSIEMPSNSTDLVGMGDEMKNCMAGYKNTFRYPRKDRMVFILRENGARAYAIETYKDKFSQFYGKRNQPVEKKELKKFMWNIVTHWIKHGDIQNSISLNVGLEKGSDDPECDLLYLKERGELHEEDENETREFDSYETLTQGEHADDYDFFINGLQDQEYGIAR